MVNTTGILVDLYHTTSPHLSTRTLGGSWVHKDATILERAVHVGNHGPNITSTQWGFSLRWELALFHVLCDGLVPVLGIALVDGEDFPSGWNSHVGVCQDKLPNRLDSVACG